MTYHIDEHSTDLRALQERLQNTDLIPSQEPLLDGIAGKMASMDKAGVHSVADLRAGLKTAKSLALLSESTGIDIAYLNLLKRAINGFFPKPRPLKDIDWLGTDAIARLNKAGIRNTQQFHEMVDGGVAELTGRTGISRRDALEIRAIADLCRIQWVSPTFARVLAAAGCANAAAVAEADPEALFRAIEKANKDAKFYRGKVGLRDIGRLVAAAAYVPQGPSK